MNTSLSTVSFSSTVGSTVQAIRDMALEKLDYARRLLSEVVTVQDAREVIAKAGAAETYAKSLKMSDELIGHAHAIRVDAMKLLGQLIIAGKECGEIRGRGNPHTSFNSSDVEELTPTRLIDLGIDEKLSFQAQRLARLPDHIFDAVRRREFPISYAIQYPLQQAEREERRSTHEHPPIVTDFHNERRAVGVQNDDPVFEPVKIDWEQMMMDLEDRGWGTTRIAGAMVITASTVQRWSGCDDMTFGYGYALLMLHKHVCGDDLTRQRIRDASTKVV